MQQENRTERRCTDDDCDEYLRARDLGAPHAYPRANVCTPALRETAELSQCVAFKRDGERCENAPLDRQHVCGVHGPHIVKAIKDGFEIHTDAYAAPVWTRADGRRAPHVRMIDRARPHGREWECPIHGIIDRDVPA